MYHGGSRSLKYVVATPASDDVGPSTNIGPAESAPTGYTPALPTGPTKSVGYASHPHRSPAFFSMATGTSDTPTKPTGLLEVLEQSSLHPRLTMLVLAPAGVLREVL